MKFLTICLFILSTAITVVADDIAVTIYNSNLGVVSETRTLEFSKGINRIAFQDVPSAIDASSVRFDILDNNKHLSILEQNYAYDLVSSREIYKKYVDHEIELVDKSGTIITGTLLVAEGGGVVLKDKSGKIKILNMDQITAVNFPELPDGLITRPTLFWQYNSDFSGKIDCNISYQTSGIGWEAEYVGLLSSDEKTLDINGWASIHNQSGKTYSDATLKLIAGDINRINDNQIRYQAMKSMTASMDESAGFEEKSFFEYHMYTLPRKATIADKEDKQISLFEPAQTESKKVFIYKPDMNPTKVEVALTFKNSKEFGLGMPLPAGRFRLFKADDDGSKILLGEDKIEHTPKDEKVSIKVGYAFDLTPEQKVTNNKRLSPNTDEQEFEITLTNHKDETVTILTEKKLYGFWEIVSADFEYTKKDANTIQFEQNIEKNGSKTLKFTVRFNRRLPKVG